MNYLHTILSATSGATATASAAISGDKVLTYATLFIAVATTLSNFALETYRKWRDRDSDLKEKNDNNKETNDNERNANDGNE